jgi:hypothetical protein
VAVDLRERQLLAKLVPLAAVAGEVDRLGVQKSFVEPVELQLDASLPLFQLSVKTPWRLPRGGDSGRHQSAGAFRRDVQCVVV